MEEDLTELAEEAKEDDENDDREDEKKGWLSSRHTHMNTKRRKLTRVLEVTAYVF